MSEDISLQKVQDIFRNKHVLILGDSIMRGIYRDICCLLSNNSRLLQNEELIFNRHKIRQYNSFGDEITLLHVDRTNSTLNREQRVLQSDQYHFNVCYTFNSRVWNTQIENLLPSMKNYDLIICQSFIWDLTRYNDNDGSIYLSNLDLFLSKVQQVNKNVLWVLLPPSKTNRAEHINKLITKLNPSIIEILQKHSINTLNLAESLENHPNLRHSDGIHFAPYGHRLISEQLINFMKGFTLQLPTETTTTRLVTEQSSDRTTPISRNIQHFNPYDSHVNRRAPVNTIRQNNVQGFNVRKRTDEDCSEAQQFGIAFGLAWKKFKSHE